MSTAVPRQEPAVSAAVRPIPFHRLLRVETRKLVDTRSGKVLTAILIVLSLAAVVVRGVVDGPRLSLLSGTAGIVFGILLPVLAILTMTGEWSHRTALTTFALEPRRVRVLAAKCVPPLVATVAACVLALLVAAPVTAAVAAVQGVPPVWTVELLPELGSIAAMVLTTAMGLALGLLLLNAPAAIVIYLSSTMVWSYVKVLLGSTGQTLAQWLDLGAACGPLIAGDMTGLDVARLATATLVWVVIPLVVGALRVSQKDIG
ncbi:hypothetical protein ACFOY2_28425 [Nonomuraea purpurea]|uniref:ABC transporter permease n=1 Tax=Nonomuraea purpurea TaxID=1849276 RepID=A0ABV8GED1_9ACTN